MKSFQCQCGNRLFFENTRCLNCDRDVGFCPNCQAMTALNPLDNGHLRCSNSECGAELMKCANYSQYNVCNRCVRVSDEVSAAIDPEPAQEATAGVSAVTTLGSPAPVTVDAAPTAAVSPILCDCCRFNHTIPDLSVNGNLEKWGRLEAAKRRLFYELDLLGLPYGNAADGIQLPLTFDFKGDVLNAGRRWHSLEAGGKVYTGHSGGNITINISEADDVEREKARVSLGEPQRTLLGHFRHEIGHYYWDLLVKNQCEDDCAAVFGDHRSPEYSVALEKYYQEGPRPDWPTQYVSAYASMHPWEDFAETWATYLILVSELDTAAQVGFLKRNILEDRKLPTMVVESQKLSLALNEMNRSLGLMDAVPKALVAPVIGKLSFIHQLVLQVSSRPRSREFEPRTSNIDGAASTPRAALVTA